MFMTLSKPAPTPVTTINIVVVRIILTRCSARPVWPSNGESMPGPAGLLPFVRDGQRSPALLQFLTEFKRVSNAIVDSYFIVDTDAQNRRFQPRLLRAAAP